MALFRRENIAVPDERKDQIVYKWPDLQIRRYTKAIVAPDEVAVFLYQGQVIGTMPPGRHQVDATELPFLGMFKDMLTGGNAYRTELYFVSSREIRDRFGGRIDEVQDPQTGMLVTLRVFHLQLKRQHLNRLRWVDGGFHNGGGFRGGLEHFPFLAQVLHQFKILAHKLLGPTTFPASRMKAVR